MDRKNIKKRIKELQKEKSKYPVGSLQWRAEMVEKFCREGICPCLRVQLFGICFCNEEEFLVKEPSK